MFWRIWGTYLALTAGCLVALVALLEPYLTPGALPYVVKTCLAIWGFAAVVGVWAAARLLRPFRSIHEGAARFGRGDLDTSIEPPRPAELARLAEALNGMAAQLNARITEITRQRNERDVILASMQEAVIAIDADERILGVNRAAEEMLNIEGSKVRGRLVQEALRHADLQRYLAAVQAGARPGEEEGGALLHGSRNQVLRANSAPLRDGRGNEIGMLLLLANVTRLQRLENMGKEFVSNVSHELRTPVASIKGYAETLLDGTLESPEHAERFVKIILRQADRLNGIIEDLLSISRMENPEEVMREPSNIASVIHGAVEVCARLSQDAEAEIDVTCPPELEANINARLMEQALVNLISNAIKYGGPAVRVRVTAALEDDALVLTVSDTGPGISPEHHERLFDRFYRVDKARSRQMGGTGLGLSIVAHVAALHRGSVSIASRVGHGASFIIRIPRLQSSSGVWRIGQAQESA